MMSITLHGSLAQLVYCTRLLLEGFRVQAPGDPLIAMNSAAEPPYLYPCSSEAEQAAFTVGTRCRNSPGYVSMVWALSMRVYS